MSANIIPVRNFALILPIKDPPINIVKHVFRGVQLLPLPDNMKIIVDGSDAPIFEQIQTLAMKNKLVYLRYQGNKHQAIEKGIQEILKQGTADAVIVLDDDSLIDTRWVNNAKSLLKFYDIVWGFGFCKERDFIGGFVNIDANVMVSLLEPEYWLESGVYAFRLDAYLEVGGFGKKGLEALSDDHALAKRFIQKGRRLAISCYLQHRLLNHRNTREWFNQKVRWMGEILLISLLNIFLALISIPLAFVSPLLMLKTAKTTKLPFPVKSYLSAPVAFSAYTLALLIAYRRITQKSGIDWKGRAYRYNLQKE